MSLAITTHHFCFETIVYAKNYSIQLPESKWSARCAGELALGSGDRHSSFFIFSLRRFAKRYWINTSLNISFCLPHLYRAPCSLDKLMGKFKWFDQCVVMAYTCIRTIIASLKFRRTGPKMNKIPNEKRSKCNINAAAGYTAIYIRILHSSVCLLSGTKRTNATNINRIWQYGNERWSIAKAEGSSSSNAKNTRIGVSQNEKRSSLCRK